MKYPFWVTGFPAVSVIGTPTNAQLDLMLSDSAPNTTIGLEVLSATPPDVVTYPDLIRCRWVKTSGGYPMGEFYYHNGTTWKLEEATAVDGSKLVDGSVTLAKLSAVGGAPYDFIQVNSIGTAFQFTHTIPISQLENPGVDSKFLLSTSGGAWAFSNFYSAVEAFVAAMPIDVTQVSTRDTSGSTNQVVYLTGAGTCSWGWADELLRDGQVAPAKLTLPIAAAGKAILVNSTATGFDYQSGPGSATVVNDNGPKAYAAQAVPAAAETVVRFVSADAQSWFALASNKITLAAGTYMFDIVVPIYDTTSTRDGYVALYNATTNSVLRAMRWDMGGDVDQRQVSLKHVIAITASTDFEVRVYSSNTIALGVPINFGTLPECYQQVAITKLA